MAAKKNQTSLFSFFSEQIDYMYRCNRIGTARNYERAMRSLSSFTGGDIPLSSVTERFVNEYNAYLMRRGVIRNTISFYMRILRAVYNKAVRTRLVSQSDLFRNVYTGVDTTRKRAIDEKTIARLCRLDLPEEDPRSLARDMFIFSYCTRGMTFVDMAYLRRSDVRDGVISYTRRKTGQPLSVRVEPYVGKIIRKYCGKLTTKNTGESKPSRQEERRKTTPYIFPIITTTDPKEAYRQYTSAINIYNRRLAELSAMLNLERPLTSYTARHSWASSARKHSAPIAVISAGLGHTSEKTTRIYLNALESSAIDSVNRALVSRLRL
ncbi:MAG: site-specific integrase [Bacteroidales bacterium]|nr:site-specific integrase [Bacteroidales bacterium]